MKIAINAAEINRDGAGICYVIRGLIRGAIQHPEHEYLVVVRSLKDFNSSFEVEGGIELPSHITVFEFPRIRRIRGGAIAWNFKLAGLLRRQSVEVLIEPTVSLMSVFFAHTAQVIYDMTHRGEQKFFSLNFRVRTSLFMLAIMHRAQSLLVISETTKQEVLKVYPWYKKPIKVIPLGLNNWVDEAVEMEKLSEVREKYNLPDYYLLCVSTLQPRKNYEGIIEAFAALPPEFSNYMLVIVGGKGWYFDTIFKKVSDLNMHDRVIFLGYVPDSDMPSIYEQASALAFMSFQEGFGLPLIEAVAKGLPVAASDISVFKELDLGDNVSFANPKDVEAMALSFQEVLRMRKIPPKKAFYEKYSWKSSMTAVLAGIMNTNDRS